MTMTDGGYEDFEDFMQNRLSNNDSNSAKQSLGGEDSMNETELEGEERPESRKRKKGKCSKNCGQIIIEKVEELEIEIDCCTD
ncbi:hypothetical protein [Acetohalobium arabaticum]|uniref:Uncharacterized protein n=1 Tax=Acetohalobium arabaticum (strain ATCC 49924 / DSM 5501 / Z-7288) TaxID=574087 RepID=D9QSB6_ACEAZ|nr:hypothetical protein [Acetohalobium arabaticum]ADL11572.1 hypothetical protein Acear_0020 [Acetohalobium arabaticum DSM 5501]